MHRQQVGEPRPMGLGESNMANQGVSSGQGVRNMVMTSTGQYNVDFEAEYAARKLGEQQRGRGVSPQQYQDTHQSRPTNSSLERQQAPNFKRNPNARDELIQNLDGYYARERSRSKSGDRIGAAVGNQYTNQIGSDPEPRSYAPVPQNASVTTRGYNPSSYPVTNDELQVFKLDGHSNGNRSKSRELRDYSPLSQDLGSIANRIPEKANLENNKVSTTTQDKKNLDLTHDQIQDLKAYIWACGKNTDGELGLGFASGTEVDNYLPKNVEQLRDFPIRQMCSSNTHSVLMTPHGDVHVAGSTLHGKLGIQGIEKPHLTKFHMLTQIQGKRVKQVCCSDYLTLVLLDEGEVLQLGGSNLKNKANLPSDLNEALPVKGLESQDILQISCGDYHCAALDQQGNLYTWGGGKTQQHNKGQCGHGNSDFLERPKRVDALSHKRIEKVSCGSFHTLVLTEDKQLYSFGSGVYGECGHGEYGNVHTPKKIDIPRQRTKVYQEDKLMKELLREPDNKLSNYVAEPAEIIDVCAGGKHSLVLTGGGNVYSFGFGDQGQLGLRSADNQKKPTLVTDFDGVRITAISAGGYHSVVQTAKGDMYACGLNKDGQLGLGHNKSRKQFTHLTCFGGINIQRFGAGGNHTFFQIDEFLPFRTNYSFPESLIAQIRAKDMPKKEQNGNQQNKASNAGGTTEDASKTNGLKKEKTLKDPNERDDRNKILSNQQLVEKILNIQKMALENAQFYLQLTFCDTTFCHRFVHFEVDTDYIEQFEPILNEYIDSLKTSEKDAILHYHLQEMPSKRQLAQMDPSDNMLSVGQKNGKGKKKGGKKKKDSMMVKDLFGDVVDQSRKGGLMDQLDSEDNFDDEDEEDFGPMGHDESLQMADNLARGYFDGPKAQEKSYTLTMVCDPEDAGIDQRFAEYKQWTLEKDGALMQPRRLVINAQQQPNQSQKNGSLLLSPAEEEKFRRHNQQIGKVVFLKDRDIEINAFEREISKWVPQFHFKMHQLCARKPRYSEMRPIKYNL